MQTTHYKIHIFMENNNAFDKLTQAYNLNSKDVVFCFAVAAGAPITDTYKTLFNKRQATPEHELQQAANDYMKRNPAAKILIQRIKAGKTRANIDKDKEVLQKMKKGERDELKTRDGIIEKLIDAVSFSQGKDAISGLQTLAKLQGLDKPDEVNEEDRRLFVLTYLSNCRTCKLMAAYIDALKAIQADNGQL